MQKSQERRRMFRWPVMPICERQRRDVRPSDLLNGGLYRRCDAYRGGGGYDRFPAIYERRFAHAPVDLSDQFVVQLRGCPLDCPYCYVTRDGVFGEALCVDTSDLVAAYRDSGCGVFHLMGGAPALYLDHWGELLERLGPDVIFHSDFLLVERLYGEKELADVARHSKGLYAVSIKGSTASEFYLNTRRNADPDMFWKNLDALAESGVSFYLTYTGMPEESVARFEDKVRARYGAPDWLQDSFSIRIVEYQALKDSQDG